MISQTDDWWGKKIASLPEDSNYQEQQDVWPWLQKSLSLLYFFTLPIHANDISIENWRNSTNSKKKRSMRINLLRIILWFWNFHDILTNILLYLNINDTCWMKCFWSIGKFRNINKVSNRIRCLYLCSFLNFWHTYMCFSLCHSVYIVEWKDCFFEIISLFNRIQYVCICIYKYNIYQHIYNFIL